MTAIKELKTAIHLMVALIVLSAANICIFDTLFDSCSKFLFEAQGLSSLSHHLGSDSSPGHEDHSSHHEHGQSCTTVWNAERATFANLSLLFAVTTFCCVTLWFLKRLDFSDRAQEPESSITGDPPGLLRLFISSLVVAPQAPPFR